LKPHPFGFCLGQAGLEEGNYLRIKNTVRLAERHTLVTEREYDARHAVLHRRIHRSWRLALNPAPIPSLPFVEGFFVWSQEWLRASLEAQKKPAYFVAAGEYLLGRSLIATDCR
jgi:hypothetical protein